MLRHVIKNRCCNGKGSFIAAQWALAALCSCALELHLLSHPVEDLVLTVKAKPLAILLFVDLCCSAFASDLRPPRGHYADKGSCRVCRALL